MGEPGSETPNTEDSPPKKRWRQRVWWVRYLTYLSTFLALLIGTYAYFDFRGRLRWKAYLEEIEASGSSLDIRKLVPPAPEEGSFWEDYAVTRILDKKTGGFDVFPNPDELDADFAGLINPGKWKYGSRRELSDSFPNSSLTSEQAARRLLKVLSSSDEQIAFEKALGKPVGGFPWPESHLDRIKSTPRLPSLSSIRWWQIQAHCHIELKHGEEAMEPILLSFALSSHLDSSGSFIPVILSHSIVGSTFEVLWNGLQRRIWKEPELGVLADTLANWQQEKSKFEMVAQRERALMNSHIEVYCAGFASRLSTIRSGVFEPIWNPDLPTIYSPFYELTSESVTAVNEGLWLIIPTSVIRANLRDRDQLNRDTLLNPSLPLNERIELEAQRITEWENGLFLPPSKALITYSFGGILKKVSEVDQWILIIRAAVAAERHFLKYRVYPQTWDEMVPEWLPEVPRDVWSGRDLIYSIGPEGRPVIYSVGENEVDDGGTPKALKSQGDLVWRYFLPQGFTVDDYEN